MIDSDTIQNEELQYVFADELEEISERSAISMLSNQLEIQTQKEEWVDELVSNTKEYEEVEEELSFIINNSIDFENLPQTFKKAAEKYKENIMDEIHQRVQAKT